jgi:Cu/Ag efflux protein CusF
MSARALLLVLVLSACGGAADLPAPDPTAERVASRGRVTEVRADALVILHEPIAKMRSVTGKVEPMESMAMVFSATTATPITGFAAGDAVRFEFTVNYKTPSPLRLVTIEKLPAGTALDLPVP